MLFGCCKNAEIVDISFDHLYVNESEPKMFQIADSENISGKFSNDFLF
jgi:hypothetical protein